MANFPNPLSGAPPFFKVFFFLIFAIMIGGFAFRGCLVYNNMSEGKATYIIKVPDYNGGYTSYYTNSYTEKDGCIKFKDELGFEQMVCDKYTVETWK